MAHTHTIYVATFDHPVIFGDNPPSVVADFGGDPLAISAFVSCALVGTLTNK